MVLVNSDDTSLSTKRLLLAAAPGGLCLVQDLLNSTSMPEASIPDLLDNEAAAQNWLDASMQTWSEQTGRTSRRIIVCRDDLPALRDLRHHVRGWLTGDAEDSTPHPVRADLSFRDGRLFFEPNGDGAAAVASMVHLEALLASHTGTLGRLKACMNPSCGAAFYDLSRNGTRVWHDMKTCGNTMNLRASRARRRAMTTKGRKPTLIGESAQGADLNTAGVNTVLGPRSGPVGIAWATALATPTVGAGPVGLVVDGSGDEAVEE